MKLSMRSLSICGLSLWMVGSALAPALIGLSDAEAQTNKEKRRKRVLDYKAYEREQNRELYREAANQKRQEAIQQLKQILGDEKQQHTARTKAQLLMNLAEFYFEQSKYENNLEMLAYDDRYDEWFNLPSAQQKNTDEPQPNNSRSIAFTRKAIENYRVILEMYPTYQRVDEALFFLAFMLNELGEEKEAVENYKRLVKTHSDSSFVPDAENAIGEYYFKNDNAFKALQHYKRAARFKDSKIYTFALYKMGWCYYNVGEFGTAIDTMKELITETDRRARETGEKAGISLKEEALGDLVLFFSEEGDLQAAKEYFTRYGEKRYYRKMLSRLGNIYVEQGKNDLAVDTYRELIADNPFASDNPGHQHSIIGAYRGRDRFDDANTEIDKLVEDYGRASRWAQENADNKRASKEAERLIEKNLRTVAFDSHKQALKRRSKNLLVLAEQSYARYVGYFETGHKSYEMRYWWAEVLYKLNKFDKATELYEMTVAADPKGKFLKDASENTIFAIEKYLKPMKKRLDADAKKQVASLKRSGTGVGKYAEIELHPWESRLVRACDAYAKALPDDKKTLNFLYKAALLLHDRNHYNESNPRFLAIIRADPKSEMAQFGVHEILTSYKRIENWTKLNDAAREFYKNPAVGKTSKFKGELKNIYQRATFQIASGHAADENWPEAAKSFHSFYGEFGEAKIRDLALYNAAFYFGKANNKTKMLELRHEFVEKFPKPLGKDSSKLQLYQKSLARLGGHYQTLAAYDQSATFFRRLYDSSNKFDAKDFITAQTGLYNSAVYREALGEVDAALKDFGDYMKTWPGNKDELANRMRVAKILRTAGRTDKAMAAYKAIFEDRKVIAGTFDAAMEAYLAYGQMLGEKKDRNRQLAHYKDGLRFFQANRAKAGAGAKQAPEYAAEMRFELLEPEYDRFVAITIPADTKKMSAVLKKKVENLDLLKEKYIAVLELKQGVWPIAALYRIGTLYGNFADTLRAAPCPKKLDEDQCAIYKFGLEDKAYPLVAKAVDAFDQARQKSYELGLYTEYTIESGKQLSRLRPAEYPANAERTPQPDYTSNPYTTADFVL